LKEADQPTQPSGILPPLLLPHHALVIARIPVCSGNLGLHSNQGLDAAPTSSYPLTHRAQKDNVLVR
jgi:hypothetical protein